MRLSELIDQVVGSGDLHPQEPPRSIRRPLPRLNPAVADLVGPTPRVDLSRGSNTPDLSGIPRYHRTEPSPIPSTPFLDQAVPAVLDAFRTGAQILHPIGTDTLTPTQNTVAQVMAPTGLPQIASGIGHLRNTMSFPADSIDPRAQSEAGAAFGDLLQGGLGVAGMFGLRGPREPFPMAPPVGEWENVYRGVNRSVEPGELQPMQSGGWFGPANYVTRDAAEADRYAHRTGPTTFSRDYPEGANIMPLQVRGPFATAEQYNEAFKRNRPLISFGHTPSDRIAPRATEQLRAEGYTGVESPVTNEIAMFPGYDGSPANIRSRFDAATEAPRELPPVAAETAAPPRPEPRLPGRASDGSVLPVRPREPFRNSLRGGSDDLRDAARRNPPPGPTREEGNISSDPSGNMLAFDTTPSVNDPFSMRMERARRMGFDTNRTLYRGTTADETHAGRGGYHETWMSTDPQMASGFAKSPHDYTIEPDGSVIDNGGNVMPLFARGRLVAPDSPEYAEAVRIGGSGGDGRAYLASKGITGTIDADGRVGIIDPTAVRSRFAAFDPAHSNSRNLLRGPGIPMRPGTAIGQGALEEQMWRAHNPPPNPFPDPVRPVPPSGPSSTGRYRYERPQDRLDTASRALIEQAKRDGVWDSFVSDTNNPNFNKRPFDPNTEQHAPTVASYLGSWMDWHDHSPAMRRLRENMSALEGQAYTEPSLRNTRANDNRSLADDILDLLNRNGGEMRDSDIFEQLNRERGTPATPSDIARMRWGIDEPPPGAPRGPGAPVRPGTPIGQGALEEQMWRAHNPPPPPPQGITAYHGSPHDFDRFDAGQIGTGQGAQTYGHGHYVAENESVARSYRDQLAGADNGRMYQVRINSTPENFLDLDSPVSAQSPHIRALLERGLARPRQVAPDTYDIGGLRFEREGQRFRMYRDGKRTGETFASIDEAHQRYGDHPDRMMAGDALNALEPDQVKQAELLRNAGAHGVRYLDQGSRQAGQGTRNYVVMRDDILNITRKYGLPLGLFGGQAALSRRKAASS